MRRRTGRRTPLQTKRSTAQAAGGLHRAGLRRLRVRALRRRAVATLQGRRHQQPRRSLPLWQCRRPMQWWRVRSSHGRMQHGLLAQEGQSAAEKDDWGEFIS